MQLLELYIRRVNYAYSGDNINYHYYQRKREVLKAKPASRSLIPAPLTQQSVTTVQLTLTHLLTCPTF